nr:hypothetical protein [Nostoc sp. DedQUE02]
MKPNISGALLGWALINPSYNINKAKPVAVATGSLRFFMSNSADMI